MSDVESSNPEHAVDMGDKKTGKKKKKQQKTRKTKKVSGVKTKKYLLATGLVIVTGSLVMSVAALAMSNNEQETSAQDASKSYYTQDEIDELIEETIGEIKETIDDLNDAVDEVEEAVEDVKTTIATLETPEGSGSGTETELASTTDSASGTTSGSVPTKVEPMEATLLSLQESYAGELDDLIDSATLPSEVLAKDVAKALNSVDGVSGVTEAMVDLSAYDDATGTLTVVVTYGESSYSIELSGFQTQKARDVELTEATLLSLQESYAGELDDLIDSATLPSEVLAKDVAKALNSVDGVSGVTEAMVDLSAYDDATGTLTVVVTYGESSYSIELSGFQTQKARDVELTEATLLSLQESYAGELDDLIDSATLPSEVLAKDVAKALNSVDGVSGVTEAMVDLSAYDDATGTLTVVVTYGESSYSIELSGFQTQKARDVELTEATLLSLQESYAGELDDLIDSATLPSEVLAKDVAKALNSVDGVSGVTEAMVDLSAYDDATGTLTVVVTYGESSYSIELSGFQTQKARDVELTEATLLSLQESYAGELDDLIDSATLPSEVLAKDVAKALNSVDGVSGVTEAMVDLSAYDDATGTLTVVVTYGESSYSIELSGFQTQKARDVELTEATLLSLQESYAGELDDLIDSATLPSEVLAKDVAKALNSVDGVSGVTEAMVDLSAYDDATGTLTVVVTYGESSYSIELSGFQTQKARDVELTEATLLSLQESYAGELDDLIDSATLPSEVLAKDVAKALNSVDGVSGVTEAMVDLSAYDDATGTLTVVVTYGESSYSIELSGFQTQKARDVELTEATLLSLQESYAGELDDLIDSATLPSEVLAKDVAKALNSVDGVSGVTEAMVDLSAYDDATGTLTVVVTYGESSYSIELSGFQTQKARDVELTEATLLSLQESYAGELDDLIDSATLPSEVLAKDVAKALNSVDGVSGVTEAMVDLSAYDDATGTLTVVVTYGESSYSIELSGFQTQKARDVELTEATLLSLQESYAGELDDLIDSATLPSEVLAKDVAKALNSVDGVSGVTEAMVDLSAYDDATGTLTVVVTYGESSYSIELSGFQTQKARDVELTEATLLSLQESYAGELDDLIDSATLPSEVLAKDVAKALNSVDGVSGVTEAMVDLSAYDDATGTLTVVVTYGESSYSIELSGFQTQKARDVELTEATLLSLQESYAGELDDLIDSATLPSEVLAKDVAKALNSVDGVSGVTEAMVDLSAYDDATGTLTVVVTYGESSYSIELSGFQTQKARDVELTEATLLSLQESYAGELDDLIDSATLPSEVLAKDVAKALNSVDGVSGVTEAMVDLSAYDDATGTLTVVVTYEGTEYKIVLSGFQTETERDEEIYAKSEVAEQVEQELISQVIDSNVYGTFVDENQVLEIINSVIKNWNNSGTSASTLETFTNEDLMFRSNDAEGTLTITILNYYGKGNDLIITLVGFKRYYSSDTIPIGAYKGETLPEWFTIPETVTCIGEGAFQGATFLGNLVIPEFVSKIGAAVFSNANFLGDLVLPDSITSIANYAFNSATFQGNFTLENTQVETIGDYAFYGVTLAEEFVLPDSVKSIGNYAFANATLSEGFTIPEGATQIEPDAFSLVKMDSSLTWFDAEGTEQKNLGVAPQAGWYIGPKGI